MRVRGPELENHYKESLNISLCRKTLVSLLEFQVNFVYRKGLLNVESDVI